MKILTQAALLLALAHFAAAPAYAESAAAQQPLPAAAAHETQQQAPVTHALAMHGEPKYPADFTHFDYVNPDAPKGGTLRLAAYDTFDNLNPFIIKGVAADGATMIYDTLLESSSDEAFSVYGGLASAVQTPEDRSWVVFTIRPEAKWHDGKPVTAEDVKWTFTTLMEKGTPFYRSYYHNVKDVTVLDGNRVKFTFDMAHNRELPLIMGQLPVLPRHYWTAAGRVFENSTLTPPLGSGPYKFGTVTPGRSVEYVRVKDWWGENVPAYKGRYNFDRIVYEYFKDQNVALEAFFAGQYDYNLEMSAKSWATNYDAPAVKSGRIVKKVIENELPQGMQGFAFNIRRPVFKDPAVRKAINYAFDFEWSNKQFAYGAYTRTRSYFSNSEMEAKGLPDAAELAILEKYRGRIPDSVFTEDYKNPVTDGSGNNRANLREAAKILDAAGWKLGPDNIRAKDGVKLEFVLLVASVNDTFTRWWQPVEQNLARLGIKGTMRIVDVSQYINLVNNYDYDMIIGNWGQSNSPGNEQRDFWGSDRADMPGGRNHIGLKDPVIDELVALLVAAQTREELVTRARILDRVLQHGWYVVPNWHIPAWRIAYWDKFGQPEKQAPFALGVADTWWAKPSKQ